MAFDEEFRRDGIPPRPRDDLIVEGSEELFKLHLITPEEPKKSIEYTFRGNDNQPYKQMIDFPQLVRTMALGNLTTNEVRATRYLLAVGETAERLGYRQIALKFYKKVVIMNVTSQPHQGKLLGQVLTHMYGLHRQEVNPFAPESESDKPGILDKFRELMKNRGQNDSGGFGTPSNFQNQGNR